jgi:hypothetical protein
VSKKTEFLISQRLFSDADLYAIMKYIITELTSDTGPELKSTTHKECAILLLGIFEPENSFLNQLIDNFNNINVLYESDDVVQ